MELLGAKVVEEDVERKDVLDSVDGGVASEDVRHGGVVQGADSNGGAAVDLAGEMGGGEVVVESGEVGVIGQYARDVVGMGDSEGGEEEKEEKLELLHCRFEERERVREGFCCGNGDAEEGGE